MSKKQRPKIIIDRKEEMRTKETSRMINEGGLGSRTHYDIKKVSSPEKELEDINGKGKAEMKDEEN